MIDRCGEQFALQHLSKAKMIYLDYNLTNIDKNHYSSTLLVRIKNIDEIPFLDPRKEVRIISREDSKPPLACMNIQEVVKEIDFGRIVVDVRGITAARR
jgi:hypothetical protein